MPVAVSQPQHSATGMSRAGPAMTPAYTGNMNYHPATFHPAALLRCRQQAGECRRSAIELRAIAKASSAHKEASCEVAAAANAAVLALEQAIDAVEAAGPTDFESSTQHILRLDRLAAELAAVIDLAEIRILVRLPQLAVTAACTWRALRNRTNPLRQVLSLRCSSSCGTTQKAIRRW